MTTKTITTGRPITSHDLSHVPDSFCPGTELCAIACKKLVQEKTCTRLTDILLILLIWNFALLESRSLIVACLTRSVPSFIA